MGCPSMSVSFRPQPKLENSSPLLIHHKLWKGDPSYVQAHEDCSLLQCTYDLPIPLAHTTINSISVLVIIRVLPHRTRKYLKHQVVDSSNKYA